MKIINGALLFGFLLILSLKCSGMVMINEVMYNPFGDDDNFEFVEFIGTDNLTGFVLGDKLSNDTLLLLKFVPGNISLVVEKGFDYSGFNCSVYSAGDTIGNNLNNKADDLYIWQNKTLIDNMSYNNSLANNNNHSLELANDSWIESCSKGGSPCKPNCIPKEETAGDENKTGLDNDAVVSEEDSSIVIVDIMTRSSGLYYGDSLEVELYIYRGNTLKSVVTASLKDDNNRKVSDELKFKLTKKYTELSTVAEFRIKELCADDKKYSLIVEGLGVSDEEEIMIWKEESLCDKKSSAESSSEKKATTAASIFDAEKSCSIISFYTRTRKYAPNITLYANTDCEEGELVLTTKLDSKAIIINSSGTLKFEAKAGPGNNSYVLKLVVEGKLLDSKELLVNLEGEPLPAEREQTFSNRQENNAVVVFEAEKNIDGDSESSAMSSITGNAVYESSNVKLTRLAPMLGVIVVLLIIAGFILIKKKNAELKTPPKPPKAAF